MPTTALQLRKALAEEAPALHALLRRSVQALAADHYSAEALAAWAPAAIDQQAWAARLAGQSTIVAWRNAAMAGFISYDATGDIDLLYTDPGHARQGVASALLRSAEAALRAQAVEALTTAASRVAMPVFRAQGFTITAEERVRRAGVEIARYRMRKSVRP